MHLVIAVLDMRVLLASYLFLGPRGRTQGQARHKLVNAEVTVPVDE